VNYCNGTSAVSSLVVFEAELWAPRFWSISEHRCGIAVPAEYLIHFHWLWYIKIGFLVPEGLLLVVWRSIGLWVVDLIGLWVQGFHFVMGWVEEIGLTGNSGTTSGSVVHFWTPWGSWDSWCISKHRCSVAFPAKWCFNTKILQMILSPSQHETCRYDYLCPPRLTCLCPRMTVIFYPIITAC